MPTPPLTIVTARRSGRYGKRRHVAGSQTGRLPTDTANVSLFKFEEVIDHATAGHNARRKIVREDSDGRRLINELEQIVVHACWELLSCLAS